MAKIIFRPSGKTIEVPHGTLLFDAVIRAGLPIASSCSAEFVCGKCNLKILEGAENLSGQREPERRLLRRDQKPETDRISCVTRVYGDCVVTASYW
jgi:ferredoxin